MTIVLMICAILPLARSAWADSRKEIEDRLEQRYPKLFDAEMKGKVGEAWQGYVEAVEKSHLDEATQKLIDAENADRKELYRIIAENESEKHKITPSEVGERNARRKFDKAKPEQYLKAKDGTWFQRRDLNRLKKDGKIGEQWDGYLGAVREGDGGDRIAGAVLETENRLRRDDYERLAYKRKVDVKEIAENAGKDNIEKARNGEYVKNKNGKWEKK
jgi:uncharacterized protein YdbL (DUF1318 family)